MARTIETEFSRIKIIVHPWLEDYRKTTLSNQDLKYEREINGRYYDYREWQNPDIEESFMKAARQTVIEHVGLFPDKIVCYELISSKSGKLRVEFHVDKDARLE